MPSPNSSSHSVKSAFKAISKHAKEHHASVQGAYEAYYGIGVKTVPTSTSSSLDTTSDRPSMESSTSNGTEFSKLSTASASAWAAAKKMAKEHHRSVNAAYALHYGTGARI
jgi:hypothetical protein